MLKQVSPPRGGGGEEQFRASLSPSVSQANPPPATAVLWLSISMRSPILEGSVAIRQAGALTDAGKLPANTPRRIRAIVKIRDDPSHKRQDCCRSSTDKRYRRALANRLLEPAGNQQADAESHRSLRESNDARHGKIVAKFTVRNGRHVVAQRRFVVWDFQLEMDNRRVLGIDPGEVRVGVAVSDDLGMLAHPLETIDASKHDPCKRIAELASQKQARAIIVGVPRNMDGSFGPAAQKARALIERLRQHVECEVIPWDERLTTISAQRALREAGRKAKNQRRVIDQAAAQILLQSWLDSQA
jgi:putative holliday junction resolvase